MGPYFNLSVLLWQSANMNSSASIQNAYLNLNIIVNFILIATLIFVVVSFIKVRQKVFDLWNNNENLRKENLKLYLLEKFPEEEELIDSKIVEFADNIGYDDDNFMYGGRKRKHVSKTRKGGKSQKGNKTKTKVKKQKVNKTRKGGKSQKGNKTRKIKINNK
jgi:hypothetical protein